MKTNIFREDIRTGEMMKRCSKCGVWKHLSEYWKSLVKPGGVVSQCKKCAGRIRKYKNVQDKFWKVYHSKTIKAGQCVEWTGSYENKLPVYNGRSVRRSVYSLAIGPLESTDVVVAKCENPQCVRQLHLLKITKEEMRARFKMPYGDNHPARCHPERMARGLRHGRHTKPESTARGDRNGSRSHPEVRPRGMTHMSAKLNDDIVREIRMRAANGETLKSLGRRFSIHFSTVGRIIRRETWSHIL